MSPSPRNEVHPALIASLAGAGSLVGSIQSAVAVRLAAHGAYGHDAVGQQAQYRCLHATPYSAAGASLPTP
jgi:hypothetical protein